MFLLYIIYDTHTKTFIFIQSCVHVLNALYLVTSRIPFLNIESFNYADHNIEIPCIGIRTLSIRNDK